jgi:hypothetical protein
MEATLTIVPAFNVDDRSRFVGANHRLGGCLTAKEDAAEVDRVNSVEVLWRHVHEPGQDRRPSVADPGVEAQSVRNIVSQSSHLGRVGDVEDSGLVRKAWLQQTAS